MEVVVGDSGPDKMRFNKHITPPDTQVMVYDTAPPFALYVPSGGKPGVETTKTKATFDPARIIGAVPSLWKDNHILYQLLFPKIPQALKGREDSLGRATLESAGGVRIYSPPVKIRYSGETSQCNFNFNCERESGESYVSCPQDCLSGSSDDYCDQRMDGVCDPDCSSSSDPDCIAESAGTCGDGVCQTYESQLTCPKDCRPSQATTSTLRGVAYAVNKAGGTNVLTYLLFVVILLASAILLSLAIKGSKKLATKRKDVEDSALVESVKKRLKAGEDPNKIVGEGYSKEVVDEARRQMWK